MESLNREDAMDKELSPDLFDDSPTLRRRSDLRETSTESATFLNLDRQVLDLRQQVGKLGEDMTKLSVRLQEVMKDGQLRMDRLLQQIQRLEQSHNGLVHEAGQRIASVNQRLSERKSMEQKTQEMIDRHGQVIKSFEVRLLQMQRLLTEKESQLVGAQAALNEAKMEIARLKRL